MKRASLSVAQGYGVGFMPDADLAEKLHLEDEFEGPQSFWLNTLYGEPADIYTHPAILAAAQRIEFYAAQNEKVLVFGRFIAPVNALTRLLDAREMLLRPDGKPFLRRVGRRALGDRPAQHGTVPFQPEIVMQPARGMVLHYELPPVPASPTCPRGSAVREKSRLPLYGQPVGSRRNRRTAPDRRSSSSPA